MRKSSHQWGWVVAIGFGLMVGCQSSNPGTGTGGGTTAAPVCGNGACEAGESSASCAADCGGGFGGSVCGNGKCESSENSANCSKDCQAACLPACTGKECGPDGCGGTCGNCSGTKSSCSWSGICVDPNPAACGNGKCEASETAKSCPSDCGAGHYCDSHCGETTSAPSGCYCDAECMKAGDCCMPDGSKSTEGNSSCGGSTCQSCKANTQACKNECTSDICSNGMVIPCQQGSDGCYKKMAVQECSPGLVCKAGGKGCTSCSAHADCESGLVCGEFGLCGDPYYESYKVTIHSAEFPLYTGSEAWDAGGGLPDPKICINDGSKTLGCTKAKSDVLVASFEESFTVTFSSGSKLCFNAYDTDLTSDDDADGVCWANLAAMVKSGGYTGLMYEKIVSFSFSIEVAQ